MLETIRSTLLLGLGAGVITKEKAEQAVRGLVERGKLTKEEAEQLVTDLVSSGSQQWIEVQSGIRDSVRSMLDSADVARAKDVEQLSRQLENAEQRISMLEDSLRKLIATPPSCDPGPDSQPLR